MMEDLIKALQIFSKYTSTRFPTSCEHDVLYINDVVPEDISEEGRVALSKLGFWVDEEMNGFTSFRFGG